MGSGVQKDLQQHTLSDLQGRNYSGKWICDWTTKPGEEAKNVVTHYSYSYASQLVVLDKNGKIDCIYAAHDAGKIMTCTEGDGVLPSESSTEIVKSLKMMLKDCENYPIHYYDNVSEEGAEDLGGDT